MNAPSDNERNYRLTTGACRRLANQDGQDRRRKVLEKAIEIARAHAADGDRPTVEEATIRAAQDYWEQVDTAETVENLRTRIRKALMGVEDAIGNLEEHDHTSDSLMQIADHLRGSEELLQEAIEDANLLEDLIDVLDPTELASRISNV